MSVKLTFAGLDEFKQALRNLPHHLAEEAAGIVLAHAQSAGSKIKDAYPEVTGNLKKGVKVDQVELGGANNSGAIARVRSTSRHSHLYEYGTEHIRYFHRASRGRMPGAHVFVPIVVRERRAMVEDLIGMVQNEGFKVSGGGSL